jgi:hypothetical protein
VCAHRLASHDGTPNTTGKADWPSGANLRLARRRFWPSCNFSASPDAESDLREISPPHPMLSSTSGEFCASPELGLGHLIHRESRGWPLHQLWHTSRDGSFNTSGRLSPRPSMALTSINAIGNHNIITRKDDDAPISRRFTHIEPCYNNYDMGIPFSEGLGRMDNPSASALALSGKPAGTSQQCSAPSRQLARRQDISPLNTMTPGFTADIPFMYK